MKFIPGYRPCAALPLAALIAIGALLFVVAPDARAASQGWVATDTFRVMNFTVLAVGLFLLLRKPAGKALNDRIESIKAELEELESRKADAEQQLADYEARLTKAKTEAEEIKQTYIRNAEEAKVRILAAARENAEKMEEQARRNIEQEFKAAREQIQAEIIDQALDKAEASIRQRVTAEDQKKLVDEFLEKVVA